LWGKLGRTLGIIPHHQSASLSLPGGGESRVAPLPPTTRIRDILFEKSPYEGFDPLHYSKDMQGWGSDVPALVQAIQIVRPSRICEVGSWKGRSAINMARAIKSLDLPTEIVCVDTWLGSPEHWLKQEEFWYESLRIMNGMPHLYYTFLANVARSGVADVITPFPMTSENAARVFAKLKAKFDIVYIDAAHEYEAVKRDINAYYDLIEDDGLLIGDDYLVWEGVTRAADDFASERDLHLAGVHGKFIIPKGQKYAEIVLS
jgi:predicted O-methyltransferase YrrM